MEKIITKTIIISVLIFLQSIGHTSSTFNAKTMEYSSIDAALAEGRFSCDSRYQILFGNGMITSQYEASIAKDSLQSLVSRKISSDLLNQTDFHYIYNPTFGFRADLIEAAKQKVSADTSQVFRWASNLDYLPDWMQEEFIDLSAQIDRYRVSALPVTRKHIRTYNALLNRGRRVAVVPHSQGNLFVNEAYLGIYLALKEGVGIVSTANPDDEVADASANHVFASKRGFTNIFGLSLNQPPIHINIVEDWVMRGVRSATQTTPGHNFDNYPIFDSLFTGLGHDFINNYLDTEANNSRTAANVIVAETIERYNRTHSVKCHTPLLTAPNGLNAGPIKVADNGEDPVDIAPFNNYMPTILRSDVDILDWKGGYINGIASKTVSYSGPSARFIGTSGYGNYIYRDGRPFYQFPAGYYVLGAALATDANGDDWVVAITNNNKDKDTLFRRKVKKVGPLEAVDLDASMLPDPDNADKPYWIKVTDIVHEENSSRYAPWFFNGSGTEAQTLRRLPVTLGFGYRDCPYNEYCPVDTVDFHDVEVINRYKLKLSSDLHWAQVSDMGYEAGTTGILAVDYLDDEELILRSRNIRTGGFEPINIPADKSYWLDINGEPLMDETILKCRQYDQFARLPFRDTAFSPHWDGLVGRWNSREYFKFGEVHTLHLYYLDLRTKTFEYSSALQEIPQEKGVYPFEASDVANIFDEVDVEYYYAHQGESPKLMGKLNKVAPVNLGLSLMASPYGREGSIENAIHGNYLIPPTRGQYVSILTINAAPRPISAGRVVEPDGSLLISNRLPDGTTFNYYSKGDLQALTGADLNNSTVLPVGLN